MAKGKKKLNKTNSSGWLDDYSEESVINKYADGDKVVDPLLSPGQLAQLNKLKELSKKLSSDKAKKNVGDYIQSELTKKSQEKQTQSTVSTLKKKSFKDKVKEATYNPLATLTATEKGNKFDEFIFGTPAMMANSAINTVGNVFSPSAYSAMGKGLVNMAPALANMALDTEYQPVFNDGSSERALEIGTDALMALPIFLQAPKTSGFLTKNTLLKNTYNYNPWANKTIPWEKTVENANKSFRVAGLDALEDFQNTGFLRSRRILPENATFADKVKARPTEFPSFQQGYADLDYLPEEGGVIFETSLPTFKRGELNPVTGNPIKGRHYAHRVIDPKTGKVLTEIPSSEIKAYKNLPHWLKGYVPINRNGGEINQYAEGGKVKDEIPNKNLQQYFKLPTKRVAIDNTYNKNSPIVNSSDDKEMVNSLLREKANQSQKAKEKRIADVRRLEELNQKSMLETANAKDLYDIGEGMKSKYRFSNENNFFDDYINPFNIVGGMAGRLAQTPELINQGDYTNAALALAAPLGIGAIGSIGANTAKQFLNNTFNPVAASHITHTPALVAAKIAAKKTLQKQGASTYERGGKVKDKKSTLSKLKKALFLKENLGNLDTKEGYFTPLNQLLKTAVGMEGKDYSNESMEPIAREQDALRMYLGLPTKTGAFEQTGPNKYRIRDYNKLYPDTLLSDEAVRNWGVPNEDGVPDPVNPAFDLYPYDDFVMGKHYVTKGKDAKGEYLKYSDRFDFDPTRYANQFIDRNVNPNIGKYLKKATPLLDELESLMFNPFELEDKIYYDPKTKLRSDIILQQNAPKVYPGQPMAVPAEFQSGGKVNDNNGYLISNLDNFTPKKIINSNYITTNNMAFPIEANGVVLYPNTGNYLFPTDKVTEIPIMQNGSSINNDMKKKLKKYQGGGYLNYQDSYKGFGVGPQLYQDNSYFRSVMPDNIENMEEEINQPSVFSGINDILGTVNQGVNQITGLMSQIPQPSQGGYAGMSEDAKKSFDFNKLLNFADGKTGANLIDTDLGSIAGRISGGMSGTGQVFGGLPGGGGSKGILQGISLLGQKNGGYLRKYQNGGNMDMLPVGYPEYIHKSNVFHENYNPVPRVHFSDDTTPYDMGVNLNDLVNMYGGRVGKYQYGGMMPFYSRQRSPRVFNSNANRASAADLESAYANDFMHTKLKKDRQSFEDDKVDWGFMDWSKDIAAGGLGLLSTVPVIGDVTKDLVGDSFLTRRDGYSVGKGIGNVGMGAAKVVGGITTGNVGMIGSGVGDLGEGVGSTIGTFQAKDALSNYDKAGYVSGKRMVNASQDFGDMMDNASSLYGTISGGVSQMKNLGGLKGMMGNMKGGATGMKGFGNVMSKITGFGQDGGYIDYNFNDIEQYKYGGKVSQKINKKQNKTGWLDQL